MDKSVKLVRFEAKQQDIEEGDEEAMKKIEYGRENGEEEREQDEEGEEKEIEVDDFREGGNPRKFNTSPTKVLDYSPNQRKYQGLTPLLTDREILELKSAGPSIAKKPKPRSDAVGRISDGAAAEIKKYPSISSSPNAPFLS